MAGPLLGLGLGFSRGPRLRVEGAEVSLVHPQIPGVYLLLTMGFP